MFLNSENLCADINEVFMQYFWMLWCTCYIVCPVQRAFEDDEDEKVETNLAKKFLGLLWIFSAKHGKRKDI